MGGACPEMQGGTNSRLAALSNQNPQLQQSTVLPRKAAEAPSVSAIGEMFGGNQEPRRKHDSACFSVGTFRPAGPPTAPSGSSCSSAPQLICEYVTTPNQSLLEPQTSDPSLPVCVCARARASTRSPAPWPIGMTHTTPTVAVRGRSEQEQQLFPYARLSRNVYFCNVHQGAFADAPSSLFSLWRV